MFLKVRLDVQARFLLLTTFRNCLQFSLQFFISHKVCFSQNTKREGDGGINQSKTDLFLTENHSQSDVSYLSQHSARLAKLGDFQGNRFIDMD